VPGLVEFVEANEPRLIAFNEYVNEAGDEVSVVKVHPDAASMEAHIAVVAEKARAAYAETLHATVRIQVFGQPSEEMLAALKQQAGEGVEIALHTDAPRGLHSRLQPGLAPERSLLNYGVAVIPDYRPGERTLAQSSVLSLRSDSKVDQRVWNAGLGS
jgi:hypothetical protein